MYYEEEVIDGVLHYRVTPKGKWMPVSPKEITSELVKSITENFHLVKALQKIIDFNRDQALHQYGDANKAENWGCVIVARAAIKDYGKTNE